MSQAKWDRVFGALHSEGFVRPDRESTLWFYLPAVVFLRFPKTCWAVLILGVIAKVTIT